MIIINFEFYLKKYHRELLNTEEPNVNLQIIHCPYNQRLHLRELSTNKSGTFLSKYVGLSRLNKSSHPQNYCPN